MKIHNSHTPYTYIYISISIPSFKKMVPTNIENKAIAMILISTTEARSILSGALFGAALTAAGVYSPTVIISQMKLESFHMLKVFLSASATSAYVGILLLVSNFL